MQSTLYKNDTNAVQKEPTMFKWRAVQKRPPVLKWLCAKVTPCQSDSPCQITRRAKVTHRVILSLCQSDTPCHCAKVTHHVILSLCNSDAPCHFVAVPFWLAPKEASLILVKFFTKLIKLSDNLYYLLKLKVAFKIQSD